MANSTLEMMHGLLYSKGLRFGHPSGLARVVAAISGGHADVVPFMGPQIHDHAMTVAKVPARKYYWDAELLVDVHLAVDRWYGFDSDTVIADAYNFEVEALGAKMIYSDRAMPTVDVSHPLITTAADLDKVGSLDPSKGRIPMAVEVGKLSVKKAPGPFAGGSFCSHWSLICQAMGYPKAVRPIKRDRGFTKALFDWADERVLFPFMQAFAKAGVKVVNGADAWAAFPDLTPNWWTSGSCPMPSVSAIGARRSWASRLALAPSPRTTARRTPPNSTRPSCSSAGRSRPRPSRSKSRSAAWAAPRIGTWPG